MYESSVRANHAILFMIFLVTFGLMSQANAAATITLSQSQPGNVFIPKEPVQFPVSASSGDTVQWSVVDFAGNAVTSGSAKLVSGKATIDLTSKISGATAYGYYELTITSTLLGAVTATTETNFALVTAEKNLLQGSASRFGVQTHFAQGMNTDLVPLMSRLGISNARDEQYWASVETTKTGLGKYDFSLFSNYMKALSAANIAPMMDLTWGWYETLYGANYGQFTAPFSDSTRQAYANYANAMLAQYGKQIGSLEVWNEYNGTYCDGPACDTWQDRATNYALMLKTVHDQVKATRPDVKVVGGATVLVPLPYLDIQFQHGALDNMDAIAVHPYEAPEAAEADLINLKALMAKYNHGDMPIWATEVGYADTSVGGRKNVARELARIMAIALSQGVQRVSWYQMRDFESGSTTMGLVQVNGTVYSPAPAYAAYATAIQQYDRGTFLRREQTDPRTRIYTFSFPHNRANMSVAWTTDQDVPITVAATQPLMITELTGKTYKLTPQNGKVTLTIGANMMYINGAISQIVEQRDNRQLADAAGDFSFTQGQNNWSYLYYDTHQGAYAGINTVLCTQSNDQYSYFWTTPLFADQKIDYATMHPGSTGGKPVWTIRRWTSTIAGSIEIDGSASRGTGGDGTGVMIYVDGKQVYSGLVAPGQTLSNITATANVQVGSKVDLIVTPGPADDLSYDAVTFNATISTP